MSILDNKFWDRRVDKGPLERPVRRRAHLKGSKWVWRPNLLLVSLMSLSCGEATLSIEDFSVRMIKPLTLDWDNKESDQPFGGFGVFSASTDHAADWKLTISNQRGTRFVIDHSLFQKVFGAAWNVLVPPDRRPICEDPDAECPPWKLGEELTAVLELKPPVHPDDLDKTVLRFTIGEPATETP